MKPVKTLLIGATFFSIGYATTHPDCLIVERRETIGADFVGCADISPLEMTNSYSKETAAFRETLVRYGLIADDGRVHIFPVSAALSQLVLAKKISLLLATETVDVVHESDGYKVTLFTTDGYRTVQAESVIDTRSSVPANLDVAYKKYLNTSILGTGDEFQGLEAEGIYLKKGLYGQSVVSLLVDNDAEYTTARLCFNEMLRRRVKDSRVAAFALDFALKFEEKKIIRRLSENSFWIPSASYPTFLDAFEGGVCGDIGWKNTMQVTPAPIKPTANTSHHLLYRTISQKKSISALKEPAFSYEFDIVVVGAGTAGALAAICAAETGLRVLAVEKTTVPGGVAVAAGVWQYYYGIHAGREEEINRCALELMEAGGYAKHDSTQMEQNLCIPSAPKCIALDSALATSGCTFWTESTLSGVFIEDNKVAGLEIIRKGQRVTVSCKAVIDAADGTLSRLAGCEVTIGRRFDHKTMRFTKFVGCGRDGMVRSAGGCGGFIDEASPEAYTDAILHFSADDSSLKNGKRLLNCVIFEGSIIGKREVCSVQARYAYSFDAFFDNVEIPRPMFYTFAPYDNVNIDLENEDTSVQDWKVLINPNFYGLSVGVDMYSLITKEYDNLFLAGKHIGVGRDLVASIRMKADMEKCGEATALLAAQWVRKGSVSYDELKPILEMHGLLKNPYPSGFGYVTRMREQGVYEELRLPENSDDINTLLSGNQAELALLYIRRHATDRNLIAALVDNLSDDNTLLRHTSAIALGLIGKKDCLPVLREILSVPAYVTENEDYDPRYYIWFTKTVHCNALKAICLLERFRDVDSFDIIRAIYDDGGKALTASLESGYREQFLPQILGFAKKYLSSFAD